MREFEAAGRTVVGSAPVGRDGTAAWLDAIGQACGVAQDKIDAMQARAGAMDELLASGALTDLTNPVDDIQAQLDQVSSASSVDADLAALKAEIGAGAPAQLGAAEEPPTAAPDGGAS